MHPALVIALAAAAALPLGLWLRHDLNKLHYRTTDEQDLPHPGARWWVVWTSVLALGGVATAAVLSRNPLAHLPLFPLAMTGPWLAGVDLDVLRIPNRVLAPTAAATFVLVGTIAAAGQGWRTLTTPLVAALATGAVFAAVHFASKGGLGFGDAKLAAVTGLAMGSLGTSTVWLSVLAGSVAAVIWAKASSPVGPISYSPWLLGGCWIAALADAVGGG